MSKHLARKRRNRKLVKSVIFTLLVAATVVTHSPVFIIAAVVLMFIWLGGRNKLNRPTRLVGQRASRHIPQAVKIAVTLRDNGKCRRCGTKYDIHYDHIIPWSRGGSSTDMNNIQLLCGHCNRMKSSKIVAGQVWYGQAWI